MVMMLAGLVKILNKRDNLVLFIAIYFLLMVVFVSLDFIAFYLAFEAVLIPTFVLILG